MNDRRRLVPRTDLVLEDPRLQEPLRRLGRAVVKGVVVRTLERVRSGELSADSVVAVVHAQLPRSVARIQPVINATGVIVHTNLGRTAMSDAAISAMVDASGMNDVELDLQSGKRTTRGRSTLQALAMAVPDAESVHVVNNGAAAVLLCVAALTVAGTRARSEVIVSRGEMVEIGDGFRICDLIASTGAVVCEVGSTNRTHLSDYERAIGHETGAILKVHPSNFLMRGFVSGVDVSSLSKLDVPVIVDIGSGLLRRHDQLPNEPDVASMLRAGAALVTGSGDKLLGGPQAGLIFGRADLIERLRRHPLARALRVSKTTLAALEATLRGPKPPVLQALEASAESVRARAARIAGQLVECHINARLVVSVAAVGGGGAPDVELPSWAVELPLEFADELRIAKVPVVGRIERGRCLLDLRSVAPAEDATMVDAVVWASGRCT